MRPRPSGCLFLFMAGAPSHLELFDYKPHLAKFDGTLPPPELLKGYRAAFINPSSKLLGPKFKFARHGQSGTELSELLAAPGDGGRRHRRRQGDGHRRLQPRARADHDEHRARRSSAGRAWAPGSATGWAASRKTCPASSFSARATKGPAAAIPTGAAGSCRPSTRASSSAPAAIRSCICPTRAGLTSTSSATRSTTVNKLNQLRLSEVGDPEIATRINSYEMAFRMQLTAPDVMDIGHEPQHILDLYGAEPGKPSFANTCLLARRLLERGVRFVQIFHESWDQHGNLTHDIKANCKVTDQACAALITDLKQRGLLEDTLVVWGGEFGRTPMVQGGGTDGRDHHPNAFSMWMAGGGVKPGVTYGETDELGFQVVKDKVHVHDLHATLLHLLGFDHTRLTYRFQGRDFRLTDVSGEVVKGLLA